MLVRIFDPTEESLETSLGNDLNLNFRSYSKIIYLFLVDYSVLKVKLQDASIVIEKLNEAFPLENGRHLKRIRKIKDEGTFYT